MSHLMYFNFDFLMIVPFLIVGFWVAVAWLIVRFMLQITALKKESNELLRQIIKKLDERP
jgi:predicted membrane protein